MMRSRMLSGMRDGKRARVTTPPPPAAGERVESGPHGEDKGDEVRDALAPGSKADPHGQEHRSVIDEEGSHDVGLLHQAGNPGGVDASAAAAVDALLPGAGSHQEGGPGQRFEDPLHILPIAHEPASDEEEEDRRKPGAVCLKQLSKAERIGLVRRYEAHGSHRHEEDHQQLDASDPQPGAALHPGGSDRHRAQEDQQVREVGARNSSHRQGVHLAERKVDDGQEQVPAGMDERREDQHHRERRAEEQHELAVVGHVDQPRHGECPAVRECEQEARSKVAPRGGRGAGGLRAPTRGRGSGGPEEALRPGSHGQRDPCRRSSTLNVSRTIARSRRIDMFLT